jgi:type I restriction enzyme S subunit
MSSREWKEVKIEDICRIRRGASPRPIQNYITDKGMPWVKISDATSSNSRYINNTNEFIREDGISKSRFITKGTLILSNSATPGIPKIMSIDACVHDGWLIVDEFCDVYQNYLYYSFINEKDKLLNLSNGSVFRNLKTDIVKKYTIFLPPLPEQKAIAHILSTLDEKIEVNNQINKTLENIAQTIFKQWFVDFEFPNGAGEPYKSSGGEMVESELGMIPKGWEIFEFREFFKFVKGKKPKIIEENKFEGSYKYLTIDVLNNNSFLYCTNEKVIEATSQNVLMVMDGASSGVTFFGQSGIVASTLAKLDLYNKKISNQFLYVLMKYYEEDIKSHTTGSAIPHTDKEYVYRLKIALPKDDIITKLFNDIVYETSESIIKRSNESKILKELRDSLLPKLMSGEIRVPIEEN